MNKPGRIHVVTPNLVALEEAGGPMHRYVSEVSNSRWRVAGECGARRANGGEPFGLVQ